MRVLLTCIGISLANHLQFLGRADFAGGDSDQPIRPSVHPGYRLPILTPAELCFAARLIYLPGFGRGRSEWIAGGRTKREGSLALTAAAAAAS